MISSRRTDDRPADHRPRRPLIALALALAVLGFPSPSDAQERERDHATPDLDSLRVEIDRLSREYAAQLRRAIEEGPSARALSRAIQDYAIDISEIRSALVEAQRAAMEAQREAMEAMREALGDERAFVRPPPGGVRVVPARPAPGPPIILGQRAVAGAELAPLNPSLARYFGVESGVLVVDVAERSPAAEAGLEPGDVLVGVGGEPVETVDDVRRRLARPISLGRFEADGRVTVRRVGDGEVEVEIVREGERSQLVFYR